MLARLLVASLAASSLAAPARAEDCAALPPPAGAVIDVTPAQAGQLASVVAAAAGGDTISLADGTYALGGVTLHFATANVTLRSASGNRDAVVLDNAYQGGDLILVRASNVTIADLTVARAWNHPIHVTPAASTVTGTLIHNVRVVDPGEQAIKINADGTQTRFVDDGVIRCSQIELTGAGRPEIRNNCYTGGIDAHRARGWRIHDNVVEGFWCPTGLSEHGIHVWTGSRDTVVERNVIRNSARGIGFGLGSATAGRTYADNPCGGALSIGHYDGVIRNNFVFANDGGLFASASGFDAGIALEQACGARVLHNTVVSTQAPFSSIEGRFANTAAAVTNNLMSHNLRTREGAVLTAAGNLQNAPVGLFVDAVSTGDLHLVGTATAAIDQGAAVPAGQADGDFDGERREAARDIGADEHRPDHIFADDFETGGLLAWSAAALDGGDLSAPAAAALRGTTRGMRAVVDDTAGLFVEDATPADEPRYRARFHVDPNGFDPGVAAGHLRTRLFIAFQEAPVRRLLALVLRRLDGQYALRARVRRDDGTQSDTPFLPLDDAPHAVEVDWRRASAPGANDGTLQVWIDGAPVAALTGLDTDEAGIDFVRLGALSVKAGASGALYWDEFVSRRKTYVGP